MVDPEVESYSLDLWLNVAVTETELEVAHGGTDEHVVRRRRSVVDACCNNSCSLAVLESYCEEPTAWVCLHSHIN